ncbi:MAG TPA: TonB family protein [Candidatus Binatia bacterium]|nr:TonB family protein [Candidatus Binatia bacterium]
MPITQIPFQDPVAPPEKGQPEQLELYAQRDWEAAYRDLDARVPHLLIQLQDDLQRSRRREAAWISLLVHILLVIFILNFPTIRKYLPFQTVVVLPQSFAKDRGITFLTLPPDEQKLTRRPNTNIASDKDRIATSKRPELDPKELRKLLPSPPPGAPGLQGPNAAQPSPPQAMMQNPAQGAPSAPRPQLENNQTAQLQAPAQPEKSFSKYTQGMSPGSVIQQATQAAAARRGMGGGQEGDFGLGTGAHGRQVGAFDILSDTQGVDFGPYLQRILQEVRENWYHLIPESAEMKKGKLAIEFAITKDGQVAGMRLVLSSGDAALDRPAWGSITGSNPFPPLPNEFTGPYLALRFRFYYNPDKADLE